MHAFIIMVTVKTAFNLDIYIRVQIQIQKGSNDKIDYPDNIYQIQ